MAINNTHEIIDQLPPTVALSILRSLADSDEGLAARIVEMALSHISGVDPWGFYQFEHESESEFKDWARDAPANFAWTVVDAWKEGSPDRADVAEVKAFIKDELGGWQARLL